MRLGILCTGWLLLVMSMGCPAPEPGCLEDADCLSPKRCVQGSCRVSGESCRAGDKRGCYTGDPATRSLGTCRDGTQVCTANGTWDPTCTGEVTPQPELCDSKDNDCNGKVDDIANTAETCDGIDNDCDGKIDNVINTDNAITRSCYTGTQGSEGKGPCKGGTEQCREGRWTGVCVGEVTPQTEICGNQIDDDCNGKVDDTNVGDACKDTTKKGICQDGKWACDAAGKKVCQATGSPQQETCNGKDDDCDGNIDNQPGGTLPLAGQPCPYTGPAGTEGKGTCKAGFKPCVNGKFSDTCQQQVTPQAETCDGKDNDCDGQTDEGITPRKCYTGPAGTEGKGTCKGGTQGCSNGKWGTCNNQVVPIVERCNNNLDDDCNGKVDDVPDLGAPCLDPTRKGECQKGTYVCKGNLRVCEQRIQPITETCNGKDDDCDGNIDNVTGGTKPLQRVCYTGPAGTRSKGACKDGTQSCTNGRWSTECVGQIEPIEERCNQKDDDCDGQTDEAPACATCTTNSTRPCFAGPLSLRGRGACQDGSEVCTNGKWSGKCTGGTLPKTETCNNQDDDCDGLVDNITATRAPLQRACYDGPAGTENKGRCQSGIQLCVSGQWGTCAGSLLPQKERCDSKDNDCDGQIDEEQVCTNTARGLHESCRNSPDAAASQKCATGLLCIPISDDSTAAFCYQSCRSIGDCITNQDARKECAQLDQTTGICVARVNEGESCDVERGLFCKQGTFCDMAIRRCRKPSEAPALGICGGQTGLVCDSQHVCVPQTSGSPHGYCLKRCTADSQCQSNLCLALDAQNSACSPLGTRKINQTCGRGDTGTTLDTSKYCGKDLFCTRYSLLNPDGVCYRAHKSCASCATNRETCTQPGGGIVVCARLCGTCSGGLSCTPIGPATNVCAAPFPVGPVPFGGLCSPQKLCQKDLLCLSKSASTFKGFCSKLPCTSDADCPKVPPGAQCKTIFNNGTRACVYPCTSNSNCPAGLACDAASSVCIAPN